MPKWTFEQSLAIDKDNSNIIVSAGAGSGKTAVLTARVIRKLKDGVDINRLLVLTFTNEAASEMKDRIRKAIKKEESLKEQLDFIDSAYITTFDSYALSVLKKYHYVLKIPKNISIIDSSIINIKKREYIEEIFNDLYEKEDKNFLSLINDFCLKNDNDIKSYILKISSLLDLKLEKEEYLEKYLEDYYNDVYVMKIKDEYLNKIISLKDEIKEIYNRILTLEDDKKVHEYEESLGGLVNSSFYEDIKSHLNITLPRVVKNSKIEKEEIKNLISILKNMTIYENEEEIVNSYKSTKVYISAIIDIIKKLDEKIANYKKEKNSYEFIDVSKMAIEIVKNNEDIREEIKSFYNEIMVDEYQDTNDLQEAFISEIENNNVYMVGDIKQSIYRFRNANPLIFKNKYDNYSNNINGFKIDLVKNFRSREEVLLDINKIFDKIMDDFLGGADYKKSHQMVFGNTIYDEEKDENISNFLEIYNYNFKEYKEYSKEEIEAFIIAKDIKEKIKNGYKVLDRETSKLRPITYNDFCIIMDRGTSFDLYRQIFEYENIPLAIYRDEVLTSANDVLLLKNIIKFIIKVKEFKFDQEFKYLFTSIARSYLFEIDDNQIFLYFKNNNFKETEIYQIAKDISQRLDDMTADSLLEEIIIKFKIYEKIINYRNVQGIMVRIEYLKKMTRSLEDLGFTPYALGDYLDEMINSSLDIKYKLNTRSGNSVKIMNIHKSKGLEFPLCYYSGLYKTFNIRDFNERFMFDNKYGIITPYYKNGIGTLFTKVLAKDDYIKEEISEKIRLLYVAVTRAREKMILVAPLNDEIFNDEILINQKTRLKYRSFLDIVNTIKDNFDEFIKNYNDLSFITKNYKTGKNISFEKLLTNEKYQIKEVNIDMSSIEENKFSKINNKLLTKEEYEIMEKGTNIHYLFEIVNFKNPNYDLIKENSKYIKNFLSQELLKDVKDANIFKEYEFIYEDENKDKYHGIIDLMLEYQDHIDIIDYKLSNIDDPNYKKQLMGYKKYIENKTNKSVKTYLYSIEKDLIKEIE